jgi:diadenosine tetraphosphatase ApaH/serine/threonine PP2A family protein phosphatase
MRIALFADVHANRQALDACLAHARSRGVDRLAFLGDLVGYGADALAVVERVRAEVAAGAAAVLGNHDEAMATAHGYFNDAARAALDWARDTLGEDHRTFLATLPLTVHEAPALYVHASAAQPARWDYVDGKAAAARSAQASPGRYTFVGHVHDQVLYYEGSRGSMLPFRPVAGARIPVGRHRRWLAVVGSVGQPRDRNPAAAYALFDATRHEMTFHRVPYDHHAAAAAIRAAGLPEALAWRVEHGI